VNRPESMDTPIGEILTPAGLRAAAEAALTDFIYEHGSDFDEAAWPGFVALRAALSGRAALAGAAEPPELDVERLQSALWALMKRDGWRISTGLDDLPPNAVVDRIAAEYARLTRKETP
jgi:hypothetical protein